jgi:hypothetical protein
VRKARQSHDDWQAEAWAMYDAVGELRYVSNAIAGRMGQAEVYVEKDGERREKSVDDEDPVLAILTSQLIERAGLNVFVAGSCWLCGLPDSAAPRDADPAAIGPEAGSRHGDTTWLIASALEVQQSKNGRTVTVRGEKYKADDVYLEKIWDPHPARWEDADSPVRAALPVLRELVGLTQHVSAQIDSRLAGAGVYWIPNDILQSAKVPDPEEGQQTFADNPVLNAIMTAMILPMEDRSNAAAVVPLMMGAPGDSIGKIRHDTFSTPFDENTKELREEARRALGLNLDAPPELLQGMGDANHWGMWLVRDEVVQAHVVPRLDLVLDALTTGFYRPVLKQLQEQGVEGVTRDDPESLTLRPDASGLVQRPNRLADASQLHAVNALGDKALREAGGFEEKDAPTNEERAVAVALQVATSNPQLLDNMPEIVATVKALLDGTPETGAGEVSTQREPGSLRPLVPANRPAAAAAPNGTPRPGRGEEAAPLVEQEGSPRSGSGPLG